MAARWCARKRSLPDDKALSLPEMERQANQFAAELLMPESVCRAACEQYAARFQYDGTVSGASSRQRLARQPGGGALAFAEFAGDELTSPERAATGRGTNEAAAMSLDFLLHYGGRRLRQYVEQPPLDSSEAAARRRKVRRSRSISSWHPMPGKRVRSLRTHSIPPPCRGASSMAAITERRSPVCKIRSAILFPSAWPRLAVCPCGIDDRSLRREFAHIERIVCFIVDPFPWHEVEDFAARWQR